MAEGEEWTLFPVWDSTNRKTMIRSANHIVKETTSARSWSGFPEDATAIASNGCGDLLVLYPDDDTVWYWDHETGQSEPAEVNWGT